MGIDLPLLWAIIIGVGVMMYVVMDGFDLGIGILFPLVRDRDNRDTMVNSVAPVWDGNETWLVLGGAALLAAFPIAYSVILSALYLPLILMLVGLIWRGVAFEFRFKADEGHKAFWDKAFASGSYIATFCQGIALGAFIDGFKVENGAYAGGLFDWLTPFSIFTGIGLLVAYALLGATWLVMKTEGKLQADMRRIGRPIAFALFLLIVAVSLWTPLTHDAIAGRWFALPNFFFFAPVPVLVVLVTVALSRTLASESHAMPFVLTLTLLFLGYTGLAISMWPNIVPPDISIWEAASPPPELGFRAGRRTVHHPVYSGLHDVVLLRFPRQGEGGRGIPLMEKVSMPSSLWARLGWLLAIWAASVGALGAAALGFRWLMWLAGMTS